MPRGFEAGHRLVHAGKAVNLQQHFADLFLGPSGLVAGLDLRLDRRHLPLGRCDCQRQDGAHLGVEPWPPSGRIPANVLREVREHLYEGVSTSLPATIK
jgi:hypothetical protein